MLGMESTGSKFSFMHHFHKNEYDSASKAVHSNNKFMVYCFLSASLVLPVN